MDFKPVLDVDRQVFCGPRAVSIITGVAASKIEAMIRRGRKRRKDYLGRKIPVKGTHKEEVLRVLKLLGCKVTEYKNPPHTLRLLLEDTAHIDAMFLVNVTGHHCVIYKGQVSDDWTGAKKIVKRVWRVDPTRPRPPEPPPLPPKKPRRIIYLPVGDGDIA